MGNTHGVLLFLLVMEHVAFGARPLFQLSHCVCREACGQCNARRRFFGFIDAGDDALLCFDKDVVVVQPSLLLCRWENETVVVLLLTGAFESWWWWWRRVVRRCDTESCLSVFGALRCGNRQRRLSWCWFFIIIKGFGKSKQTPVVLAPIENTTGLLSSGRGAVLTERRARGQTGLFVIDKIERDDHARLTTEFDNVVFL